MKKKTLPLLMTVLLALASSASALSMIQPTNADIPEARAIELAITALIDTNTKTAEEIQSFSIRATLLSNPEEWGATNKWFISFVEAYEPPPASLVVLSAATGAIEAITTKNFYELEQKLEKTKGRFYFWTLAEQAVFREVTGDGYENEVKCTLPGDNHIKQEQALEIARDALKKAFSLSDDALDRLDASYSFYHGRFGEKSPLQWMEVWAVTFWSGHTNEYQALINAVDGSVVLTHSASAYPYS